MKRPLLLIVDLCLVATATLLAVYLRDNLVYYPSSFVNIAPYLCFTLVVALPVLMVTGTSDAIWRFSNLNDYMALIVTTLVVVGGALALSFVLNRLEGVPRSVPILQTLIMLMLLVGARVAMRLRHMERRKAPRLLNTDDQVSVIGDGINTLVVGLGDLTEAYLQSVSEAADRSIRIVGIVGRDRKQVGRNLMRFEILGVPEDLEDVLKKLEIHGVNVDRVVVTVPAKKLSPEALAQIDMIDRASTIEFDFLFERLAKPADQQVSISRLVPVDTRPEGLISDRDGEPATDGNHGGSHLAFSIDALAPEDIRTRSYWSIKRGIDVVGAIVMLVLLAPVFVIVGILVGLNMGLPVTFWQQRPGLGGQAFRLYKFRTMAAGHDRFGRQLEDGQRTTKLGAFLRRTRLDELPQLFSILSGQMSFVGPRPLLPRDQSPDHAARLLVRPGMTGWAQVIGGRAISAEDKAALDIWYVRNASLPLDFQIAWRTVAVVLFGETFDTEKIARARSELKRDGILETATLGVSPRRTTPHPPSAPRADQNSSNATGDTAEDGTAFSASRLRTGMATRFQSRMETRLKPDRPDRIELDPLQTGRLGPPHRLVPGKPDRL
ncbi:MAG: sugar transferase [Pseudomonadota bacterium]